MTRDSGQVYKIGRLAAATGLTVRTLHHYDHVGLVCPSGRTGSGHRLYDESDVQRLYRVLALRQVGLSLEDIGEALEGASTARLATELTGAGFVVSSAHGDLVVASPG